MSAALRTEKWLYQNLRAIERGIAEYEQRFGTKPGVVVMLESRTDILCMSLDCFDDVTPDLDGHPAKAEIMARHKSGVYLDEHGKQTDVPIFCAAETVYRTSIETVKLKRDLQAAGAVVVGIGPTASGRPNVGDHPNHRYKEREHNR